MRYFPNPAHKLETTEAGPPRWWPDKEACPRMTPRERLALLRSSIPRDAALPRSRRYAVRRTETGLEFFEAKFTREVDGDPEFHGHPTSRVPARVLREFQSRGLISKAEYRKLVQTLG
jgi:hypothetical protein